MARRDAQTTSFPTPAGVRLVAEIGSGAITVEATGTDETRIDVVSSRGTLEVAHVEERGTATIMLRTKKRFSGEHDVTVVCPPGADLDISTGSADLLVRGKVASIDFRTGSGDLSFEEVTHDVRIKTGSGDATGNGVGGALVMHGASGDLRIGEVGGDLVAKTASGDADIARVEGDVTITSVSGDIRIGRLRTGKASLRAVSGDVDVAVAPGTSVFLDLVSTSGDTRSDLTPVPGPGSADALELHASAVSGDIRVRRARA
jgi:DUF4097 and DUF4098 domain-containing protein YvlB